MTGMLPERANLLTAGVSLLILLGSASVIAAGRDQVAVSGTIYAAAWDGNDRATIVVIVTDEGDEYTVSQLDHGKDLMRFEAKSVKAIGEVSTDGRGRKIITVNRYVIDE
jgi:hypothetical protein